MGSSFDEEALKAQAVAAYSFIKSKNNAGIAPSLAMKSNVSSKFKSAVSAVSGEAIYYNGKIIEAVYSASQGGSSASSEQVWGGKVPYLVSVENDYDEYDRYYGYEKTFTESEVEDYLESYLGKSLSSDPEDWIVIESRYDSGYVREVTLDGRKTVSGRTVRESVFDMDLRSANFEVEYDDGEFIFTTYGYGHGVGLSQLGANLYATKGGYTYEEILYHYYTGVTVR
jgi:stage II sporulation protein D